MDALEFEGSSIDEAIDLALQQLGVTRDQVEVDVLASHTRGVLGIGSRKARVRVRLRQPLDVDEVDGNRLEEPPRRPRERPAPAAPPDPAAVAHAQELLSELLARMGFTVSVQAGESDDAIELAITGDSSGVLIGRHGQTLDALEYFMQRVLTRDDSTSRISIDCEQYRSRRRTMLEGMASRLALEAKSKRRSMTIEALSPRDRRIIHLALQDEPGLTTRGSGDGHYRDLLIIPDGAGPPSRTARDRRDARPPRSNPRAANR